MKTTQSTPAAGSDVTPFARGISLGRLFGIEISIHWSLAFVFALVLLNLGLGVFPAWHPDWSPAWVWLTSGGAAVLFFASVLAHELSHSLVALRMGIGVDRITLFLFGGVSEMKEEPPSPRSEFMMAVVGPLTSLGIGLAATLAGAYGAGIDPGDLLRDPAGAMPGVGPFSTLLLWLGPVNVLLGMFNLVPGFPLDGGRVFRSALWWLTGDVMKATRLAAGAGQLFGWLLVFAGFMSLFGGASAQGLWLLLIGWFLSNAAGVSYQQMFLSQSLRHVRIIDLMRQVTTLDSDLLVQAFVDDHLMAGEQLAYPVLVGGNLVGIVRLADVRKVAREKWPWTRISEIMTPREQLTTIDASISAVRAAQMLAGAGTAELAVVDGLAFVGLVEQQDVLRWTTLHPPEHT
jgi:Zn-dependent protease